MSTGLPTTASMKTKVWDDAELRKIDSEQLARYAYELSDPLKDQYPSIELFLAHWSGQRRMFRLDRSPFVDAGPLDQELKKEWNATPGLRAEFSDNFQSYTAYLRADRAGNVRILRK